MSVSKIKPSTRERMIRAAEMLVATRGMGGVSAREIAKAAGLRNNCSVQYHFGSMEGLYQELVRFRMSQLDAVRTRLLAERDATIPSDARFLIEAICLPHLALRSEDGSYSYAAFLCQYLPVFHPAGFAWLMKSGDATVPAISSILAQLRRIAPDMPAEMFDRRIASATLLFLGTLQGLSRPESHRVDGQDDDVLLDDAIRQAVAVVQAPFDAARAAQRLRSIA